MVEKRKWIMNDAAVEEEMKKKRAEDGEVVGLRDFLMEEAEGKSDWDKKLTERPITKEIALYCVNRVRYLPGLRKRYWDRLDEARREAVRSRTEKRVRDAKR